MSEGDSPICQYAENCLLLATMPSLRNYIYKLACSLSLVDHGLGHKVKVYRTKWITYILLMINIMVQEFNTVYLHYSISRLKSVAFCVRH